MVKKEKKKKRKEKIYKKIVLHLMYCNHYSFIKNKK